jgi:hypothetical protein
MSDLQVTLDELREDVMLEAEAGGVFQQEAFFTLFAEIASENGDTIDLEYAHCHRDGGTKPYRVDGHAFDNDRGTLHLAVCDYRETIEIEALNAAQLDSNLKRVTNFIENSLRPEFINALEDSGEAFEAAYPIYSNRIAIKRIRVILFTNARLAARRPPQLADEVAGIPVVYSVLDLSRYADIQNSREGPESIEVNIEGIAGTPIPCLRASVETAEHESYLLAIPGPVLAEIYGLYGARLLEQNVRTYLQARTKVNQGILTTIKEAPEMFFAYNNGLTATASSVTMKRMEDGQLGIASINDLQIVNGGQTTASILYAKDVAKSPLDRVLVQMKLSVVPEELVERIVPRISRFANTQNRISEADFFSSSPFHLQMERISRRLAAPPQAGALSGSKWFYERARGQYRDQMAYSTPAEKRRIQTEFPKEKVIVKTDLAKYVTTFDCRPDIVSKGAQKCFMHFADQTAKQWKTSQASLNEVWYRNACSMALLFRWTDKMIAQSDWYANDRGYKSQTVTYTLALLTSQIQDKGQASLNWQQLWNTQEVPEELQDMIMELAPEVAKTIRDTPDTVKNVGEYCKMQACWENVKKAEIDIGDLPDHLMMGLEDEKIVKKEAKTVARIDKEIDFEVRLFALMPKASRIFAIATEKKLLSPRTLAALKKLESGNGIISKAEQNALKFLFSKLEEEGVLVEEID